jgi:hypothetical protein
MKWDSDDFILHGICLVHQAMIPTLQKLMEELLMLYCSIFDITASGESFMTTVTLNSPGIGGGTAR